MDKDNKLWIEEWSKEKYEPIQKDFVSVGNGTDAEPKSSMCLAAFAVGMKENYKEGMKLLDYGCGNCRMANFLSKRLKDFTYYGVEPNSPYGKGQTESATNYFGNDKRVSIGLIGEEIEKEAISNADTVLLLSVFTHTTIEETKAIITKLIPIIERGGSVVFSVILGDKYSPVGNNAYTIKDSYGVVYNTLKQIEELQQQFNVNMELTYEYEADGGSKHSVYRTTKR